MTRFDAEVVGETGSISSSVGGPLNGRHRNDVMMRLTADTSRGYFASITRRLPQLATSLRLGHPTRSAYRSRLKAIAHRT